MSIQIPVKEIGWELRLVSHVAGACILLGVGSGSGTYCRSTDHNLKADTANANKPIPFHMIRITSNDHTSAVSALTFSFLSPWPNQTPAFASVKSSPSLTHHQQASTNDNTMPTD